MFLSTSLFGFVSVWKKKEKKKDQIKDYKLRQKRKFESNIYQKSHFRNTEDTSWKAPAAVLQYIIPSSL